MIVELLRVECACGLMLPGTFDNHHAAIVAAEKAGWLMQSESIGGDQCPRCLGNLSALDRHMLDREDRQVADCALADAHRALREAEDEVMRLTEILTESVDERLANEIAERERMADDARRMANDFLFEARAERDEAISRGVELWEYAAHITGCFDSALALAGLEQNWHQEASGFLADVCEALRSPHALTGQEIREAVERAVRERDEARSELDALKARFDGLSKQAERWRQLRMDAVGEMAGWRQDAVESRKELTAALAELAELRSASDTGCGGSDE